MELKNKGAIALRSLTVVVNHPDVVFFGRETFASKEEAVRSVDSFPLSKSDASTNKSQMQKLKLSDGAPDGNSGGAAGGILDGASDGAIQPEESRFVSAWIRGPDKPGEYSLKLVFYYEAPSESKHAKLNYRVLYHKSMLVSRPALHLISVASRGHLAENCDEKSSTAKSKIVSIDFEVQNAANSRQSSSSSVSPDLAVGGGESSAVEFQLLSATCVSKRLRLLNESATTTSVARNKINFGEHLLFSLAGEKVGPDETMVETSVVLNVDNDVSGDVLTTYPSSQFALRSKQLKETKTKSVEENSSLPKPPEYLARVADLENVDESRRLDSVMILSWRASVQDAVGNQTIIFGQHHACLNTLDDLVRQKPSSSSSSSSSSEASSHLSVKPPVVFPAVNHHVRRRRSLPKAVDSLKPGCLSQLLSISLAFPSQTVLHDFETLKLCRIPVSVIVVNTTMTEIGFVLETGGVGGVGSNGGAVGGGESSTPSNGAASPAIPFSWSGPMIRQRRLGPGAEVRLKMVACIDRVGSFNLSAFTIRAAPSCVMEGEEGLKREEAFADSSSLTVQKCNPVRTVIVKNRGG